ncbi:hypothetical protein FI667_g8334, partial [Globisporangium splendens]
MQPPSTPRKLCVAVAPVSPLAKCMSRKRVRTCAQPEHEEDELAFVDVEAVDCENDLEEAYAVMTPSKRARSTVSEDIASLKVSARQVEAQVAEACVAMQELRSLVKLLAAQHQSATTCA